MSEPRTKRCQLLEIAAELRNEIYELTFTTNTTTNNEEIDLATASPPSKALLQTCRQIHTEAKPLHRRAYRHFWTSTPFILDARTNLLALDIFLQRTIKAADLENIRRLRIPYSQGPGRQEREIVLDSTAGIWELRQGFWTIIYTVVIEDEKRGHDKAPLMTYSRGDREAVVEFARGRQMLPMKVQIEYMVGFVKKARR